MPPFAQFGHESRGGPESSVHASASPALRQASWTAAPAATALRQVPRYATRSISGNAGGSIRWNAALTCSTARSPADPRPGRPLRNRTARGLELKRLGLPSGDQRGDLVVRHGRILIASIGLATCVHKRNLPLQERVDGTKGRFKADNLLIRQVLGESIDVRAAVAGGAVVIEARFLRERILRQILQDDGGFEGVRWTNQQTGSRTRIRCSPTSSRTQS